MPAKCTNQSFRQTWVAALPTLACDNLSYRLFIYKTGLRMCPQALLGMKWVMHTRQSEQPVTKPAWKDLSFQWSSSQKLLATPCYELLHQTTIFSENSCSLSTFSSDLPFCQVYQISFLVTSSLHVPSNNLSSPKMGEAIGKGTTHMLISVPKIKISGPGSKLCLPGQVHIHQCMVSGLSFECSTAFYFH